MGRAARVAVVVASVAMVFMLLRFYMIFHFWNAWIGTVLQPHMDLHIWPAQVLQKNLGTSDSTSQPVAASELFGVRATAYPEGLSDQLTLQTLYANVSVSSHKGLLSGAGNQPLLSEAQPGLNCFRIACQWCFAPQELHLHGKHTLACGLVCFCSTLILHPFVIHCLSATLLSDDDCLHRRCPETPAQPAPVHQHVLARRSHCLDYSVTLQMRYIMDDLCVCTCSVLGRFSLWFLSPVGGLRGC